MNRKDLHDQQHILHVLHALPRKMLSLHGRDNVTEFVLSELCGKDCFNITKAAYFVNNPDFNCCKGVAGFSVDESYTGHKTIWESPEDFSRHMSCCSFNQQVRGHQKESFTKEHPSEEDLAKHLAHELGFNNAAYCSWDMKNDNHGLLIFEKPVHLTEKDESLVNGLHYLGFCPIF